ncbi:MAG: ABC transporter permease [Pseudorhodoplanes sp.]|uniref:ABC transporter permease n=1 Tax=Pseudorhodoplanes sp. TaxID=1934341 RepID=UPI003D102754
MTSRAETLTAFLQRTLPLCTLLLAWEISARSGLVNAYVFPPVSVIVVRWLSLILDGSVFSPLWTTFWRASVGLGLAILVGTPLGILIGRTRWAKWLFEPIVAFFFPLPKIALIPLYVHLFGLFSLSKIMLIFTDCLFPIIVFTYHGAQSISPIYLWSAQARGTGQVRMFWRVVFPMSLASLYDGIQVAVVVAVLVAVVSEMVSGGGGLGHSMMVSFRYGDVATAFAYLVTISLLGFTLYKLVQMIRDRVLFWHVSEALP